MAARDLRLVVVHTPGPNWQPDLPMFEQPGLQRHVDHYRQWIANGKLAFGGPFLDARAGGMMIPAAGVDEDEVRQFALADPCVVSGLLEVTLRPWIVGMKVAG